MEYRKNLDTVKRKEDINKKAEILNNLKKQSIISLASNEGGRLFLYFMMKDCGFGETSLIFSKDNEINQDATIVNEVLRRYYLGVRRLIPTELLKEIEYLDINKIVQAQIEKGEKQ